MEGHLRRCQGRDGGGDVPGGGKGCSTLYLGVRIVALEQNLYGDLGGTPLG